MTSKLKDYEGYQILNFDATWKATWKEKDPKFRVTFAPVIQYAKILGFRPCFVLSIKCSNWSIKPSKTEEKKILQWPGIHSSEKNIPRFRRLLLQKVLDQRSYIWVGNGKTFGLS